jgi:hypothetical protein
VQRQYEELPDALRDVVMQLDGGSSSEEESGLRGIVAKNRVARDYGGDEGVVCVAISRFNHSCDSNCEQSWDDEAEQERVHASRSIREGEELTLPYVDLRASASGRDGALFRTYGFRCACPVCTMKDPMGNVSRDRIKTLQARLDSVVEDAYEAYDARPGIDMAAELLELYDQTPLGPKIIRADACYAAFVLSIKADDLSEAKGWIRKAYQHSLVARGKDHPDTKALGKLVKDPEDSPFSKKNDPQEAAVNAYVGVGGVISLGMLFQIFDSLGKMQRMTDPFA